MTELIARLDPRRKTALAVVTGHAAGGFLLDKSLYHAPDARYHHKQPCDKGHALVEGSKLKIHKVAWDKCRLVHRTEGALPRVGAKAQLHLDAPRRELLTRAHTLMHVALAALAEGRAEHLAPPEVLGNGEVRLHARMRAPANDISERVKQLLATRAPVEMLWMARDDLARIATPQHVTLAEVAPEEATLRVARIGEWSALPCDAPLVEHVWQVGDVEYAEPTPAKGGFMFRLRPA